MTNNNTVFQTELFFALAAIFFSFLISYFLTPHARNLALRCNCLDLPDGNRKMHKAPVPYFGGLSILVGFLTAAFFFTFFLTKYLPSEVYVILIGSMSICFVGLLDDIYDMHPLLKFAAQIAVAVFTVFFGGEIEYTTLFGFSLRMGPFSLPVTVVWIVLIINAVNLIDGLDGLAGGTSVPFFVGLGVIISLQAQDSEQAVLCFCTAGAVCAYLLFNTYPASVFMGDTGSLALGGIASCVATFTGNALYIVILGIPFVLSVVSVVIQVAYFKLTGGKRVFLMAPIHHHFQKKGYSESKIAYAYSLISALLGAVCICSLL